MRRYLIAAVVGFIVLGTGLAQPDVLLTQAREQRKQGQIATASKLYMEAANSAAAASGESAAPVATILDEQFDMLFAAGRYADCVPVAERYARNILATARPDSLEAAAALNRVALAYKLSGRVKDAGPLYERALAVFRKLQPDTPATAQLMHNLAAVYTATGRGDEAERLYLGGLDVARKTPAGQAFAGQGLHNLATFYTQEGRTTEAVRLFRQALAEKQKVARANDPTVAVTLNNLAGALLTDGNAKEAEELLARALRIFAAGGYSDHPHAVVVRNTLAEAYRVQGRSADAEKLSRETVGQLEKAVGPNSSAVAGCLTHLARALKDQNKSDEAEAAAKRAVAIRESKLEAGHPDTIAAWTLLADVLRAAGKLDDAEPLYRKAKSATDARFGKAHPKAADARRDLALCLTAQCDYTGAEALLVDARKALAGNKTADPFALRRIDHATAELYRETGRLADAEPLYSAALKAAVEKLGPTHPLTTSWAYDAALLLVARARYAEADQLLAAVVTGREKTFGPSHPATVAALELRSEVKQHLGRAGEAEELVRKVLDRIADRDPLTTVRMASNLALRSAWAGDMKTAQAFATRALAAVEAVEKKAPLDDPLCWMARHNAAYVAALAGDVTGAVREYDLARRSSRRFLAEALPGLNEREQLFVLEKFDRPLFHHALGLGVTHPDAAARTAEWLLNGKAVAHEAIAAAAHGVGDRPPVRGTLNLRRQSAGISIDHAARKRPADPWVSLETVRVALPDGAVLIDVVRLDGYVVKNKGPVRTPPRYVAWVTGKAGAPKVVDLGPAATVDAAVAAARKAIEAAPAAIQTDGEPVAEKKFREAAAELAKVLAPLTAAAGPATTWYVAPDGDLWLFPWAALPTPDGYLVETVDVRYVTSGRDLLRRSTKPTDGGALVVADPDFDAGTSKMREAKATPAGGRGVAELLGRVGRLPGTGVEARVVAPKLAEVTAREPTVLIGERATERALKAAARPRVLILATHGFYLPPDPAHRAADRDWFASLTLPLLAGDDAVNPLRRSGLLLAGCNREPDSATDDGVLTGFDVLGLDLRGCELVVLSACETGLGEVRDGEGVGGLRQAFLAAGAERVMSALWQVPDLESARLMSRCFELQAAGKPVGAALREAQREAVQRRREKNAAAHPFFWAAYTLTGHRDGVAP